MNIRILIPLLLFSLSSFANDIITLNEFIQQATKLDPGAAAAEMNLKAAEGSLENTDLLTGIRFFTQLGVMDDQRPTQNPNFQGTKTTAQTVSLGLQQQSLFGPRWSLSHNINKMVIEDAALSAIPMPEYYDVYPKLELTVPLWRNWLGQETQSDIGQAKQGSQLNLKASQLESQKKLIEIEQAYWALLTAREQFDIQKDSLVRAEKLLTWASERARKNLGEKSDVFQMRAAVKAREIELENSRVNLIETSRKFNSYRGLESENVSEQLDKKSFEMSQLRLASLPVKTRMDLTMNDINSELGRLEAQGKSEKLKPQLDFNVTYQGVGRDKEMSAASSDMNNNNYWMAGVYFNLPLDQLKVSRVQQAYDLQQQAKMGTLKRGAIDQGLIWQKTIEQGKQLEKQLELLAELESVQKEKVEEEKRKLAQGRSTTFQVLNFEQDYYNARSQRLAVEFGARQFVSSLKLFN